MNSRSAVIRLGEFVSRAALGLDATAVSSGMAAEIVEEILKLTLSRLSWLGVRSVGNLQILTKASYISLLLVPVVAGIWPFIRNTINNYNETIEKSARVALEAVEKLDQKVEALSNSGESHALSNAIVQSELNAVTSALKAIGENYTFLLQSTNMPSTFAFAFFASLAVAFGHLVYQAFCPENIKTHDLESYTLEKLTLFNTNNSDIVLQDSSTLLEERLGVSSNSLLGKIRNEDIGANDILRAIVSNKEIPSDGISDNARFPDVSTNGVPAGKKKAETTVIEVAARVRYSEKITENVGLALIALLLYGIAGLLISIIVIDQIRNVLLAVGWA